MIMRGIFLFLMLVSIFSLSACRPAPETPITEAWMKSYTGTSDDGFFGVAVDSQNNVIVTGLSWNACGTGGDDYLTIKYDSNGNVQWMKSYTVTWEDRAFGVAVDSQKNGIVT